MRRKLIPIATAVAALAAPAAVPAQQQQPPPAPSVAAATAAQPMAVLASELIGKDVVNSRGEGLGEVQNLAVDIRHNRVHYAMLDMQGKMFAYPLRVLGWSSDGQDVVLNVSEQQLERAPGMDRSLYDQRTGRASVSGSGYDRYWSDVDSFWREQASVQVEPRQRMQLVWADKLIGWNVNDRDSTSIGEIEDLVIDPASGAVQFAAVDFNDNIGGRQAKPWNDLLHPLPLDAFETRDGNDDLVLKTDPARLQASAAFTEDELARGLRDRSFVDDAARYAQRLTGATATSSAQR